MKKVIVIVAAFVMVFAGKVSAQSYTMEDCLISSLTINEGFNRVIVKTGSGVLAFYKEEDRFSNLVYIDAAGNATQLRAGSSATGNMPTPSDAYPIRNAGFSSADGSISVQLHIGRKDL